MRTEFASFFFHRGYVRRFEYRRYNLVVGQHERTCLEKRLGLVEEALADAEKQVTFG